MYVNLIDKRMSKYAIRSEFIFPFPFSRAVTIHLHKQHILPTSNKREFETIRRPAPPKILPPSPSAHKLPQSAPRIPRDARTVQKTTISRPDERILPRSRPTPLRSRESPHQAELGGASREGSRDEVHVRGTRTRRSPLIAAINLDSRRDAVTRTNCHRRVVKRS